MRCTSGGGAGASGTGSSRTFWCVPSTSKVRKNSSVSGPFSSAMTVPTFASGCPSGPYCESVIVVSSVRYAWPTGASAPLMPMRKPATGIEPGRAFGSRLMNVGLSNR